ncbi:DHS-like NAD/FAD-binding domain-containing protein [Thozetella sp. PMI_491]|nr:DHS-like NAD/FAD-binding domain-containing protein [Thozetella sp. PMI_491]
MAADAGEEIQVRTDGPPPKRRRIAAPPKPRTTAYVELDHRGAEGDVALDRLVTALRKKKKIIVIAGAGISVSAGIPDFRSSTGLFTTLRGQHKLKASGKHLFDASVYKHDSSTSSFHTMVREMAHMTSEAKPTPFHHLLASLAKEGRLMRLYTQNVDGIDTQMEPLATTVPLNTKGPWPTTIQLHGGLEKMVCSKCGNLENFNGSLFEGPEPPPCLKCEEQDQVRTAFAGKRSHGIGRLRPRIVLYNEYNPDEEAIGNVSKADLRRVPDAVIVVGTSLKIPGVRRLVKEMCQLTRSRRDGITAWLNTDPEPVGAEFKDCWDFVIRGKCDHVAEMVNLPHWDEQEIGDSYRVDGDEQKEERFKARLGRDSVEIHLESRKSPVTLDNEPKSKLVEKVQGGIPTPSASPRRTPLPFSPQPKSKTKQQSLLAFDGPNSKRKADDSAPAKVSKTKKPRQTKKDALKGKPRPKNNLAQTFKATKNVAAPAKDLQKEETAIPPEQEIKQEDQDMDSDLSDLPSDCSFTSLPQLRPIAKVNREIMYRQEGEPPSSVDVSFVTALGSPATSPALKPVLSAMVSPEPKPVAIDHLVD